MVGAIVDVHRTATDSHVGAELDLGLFFATFARKTFSRPIAAGNLADSLATVRIPSLSSIGVALPADAIFYTGRLGGDCGVRKRGFTGAVRTAVPFAGCRHVRALSICGVDLPKDPVTGADFGRHG
jgi:hypothetical protein